MNGTKDKVALTLLYSSYTENKRHCVLSGTVWMGSSTAGQLWFVLKMKAHHMSQTVLQCGFNP